MGPAMPRPGSTSRKVTERGGDVLVAGFRGGEREDNLTRSREAAKNKAGKGWRRIPGGRMKTLTHSHRLVVWSPGSSAGGATDDRPGRKPGFTGPP